MHLSICTTAHPCSVEHRCPAARSIRILGSLPGSAREREAGRRKAAKAPMKRESGLQAEAGGDERDMVVVNFFNLSY